MTTRTQSGAPAPGLNARDWLGERPLTQILVFVALIGAAGLLGRNLADNMARVGLTPGFAFLWHPAHFEIGEALIAYNSNDSFGRAILVGLVNTLTVSFVGCAIATIVGVVLGVARLSSNPLLAGSVRAYVEIIRNTPLLLQLFFWNAIVQSLPSVRQAVVPFPGVLLSNRGVFVPSLAFDDGRGWLLGAVLAAGIVYAILFTRYWNGSPFRRQAKKWGILVFVAAVIAALVLGQARLDIPQLKGFNVRGGVSLTPEFSALLIGLVVNAAAGISEIVRGGIESVPRGQWEAARAIGLRDGPIMRLIVLPQALRVIVPLMTSSYLSLTKNSSLAVAIGYPDLVNIVNTTANQTGQAFEAILILFAVYLSISLTASYFMNRFNARYALRGAAR